MPGQQRTEKCATCKFWVETTDPNRPYDRSAGVCHALPPSPQFPSTNGPDWCGLYEIDAGRPPRPGGTTPTPTP